MNKILLLLIAVAASTGAFTIEALAADHLEAPATQANSQLDISDLYVFESNNTDNAVFILTVNPFAGGSGVVATNSPTTFQAGQDRYQFQIDNDGSGDAQTDLTYSVSFGNVNEAGTQDFDVDRVVAGSNTRTRIASGTTGASNVANVTGGGQVTAGTFDDPFFFDFAGFNDGLNFDNGDTFAGANVSAIVFEIDKDDFLTAGGGTQVGVLGVTNSDDIGTQFDRFGRPAIATVLIPGDDPNTPGINESRKDEFNLAVTADDFANFNEDVSDAIFSLNGGDRTAADGLAMALLPDITRYDTSNSAGFGSSLATLTLNGRRLEDDVIDAELQLLTGNSAATDGVDANDSPFLNVFPFLAAANPVAVPEPAAATLLLLAMGGLVTKRRR